MGTREASKFEKSDLEALLRTCEAAGLLRSRRIDGETHYEITELGRALPQQAWIEIAMPRLRPQ